MTDWALILFDRFVHPTQVEIMTALDWIGEPLSASQFVAMSGDEPRPLTNVSYHFRRLELYGLLQVAELRPVRGAIEVMFAPAV